MSGPVHSAKIAVTTFLSTAPSFLGEDVVRICDQLISKLPLEPSAGHFELTDEHAPRRHARNIMEALWEHAVCRSCDEVGGDVKNIRRHSTRLYLGSPQESEGITAMFDVLISSHSLSYWQEIGLGVLSEQMVKFSTESPPASPLQRLSKTAVSELCRLINNQNYARIMLGLDHKRPERLFEIEDAAALHHGTRMCEGMSLACVLRDYRLTVPDKITLSHAIVRTFWQLYDTKATSMRWTNGSIWFIPGDNGLPPCKMYVSFPLDSDKEELDEPFMPGLIHKCPSIFSLAVLLLQIGLGRPVEMSHLRRDDPNFVRQANLDYGTAMRLFREIKGQSWEGYTGKRTYENAIEECLDGKNFSPSSKTTDSDTTPIRRQEILHEKVVGRLRFLANSLSRRDGGVLEREPTQDLANPSGRNSSPSIEELSISAIPSFHTNGRMVDASRWMDDLKVINRYIRKSISRESNVTPIRVAILDSGCDLQTAFFQDDDDSGRTSCVVGWKDFVDGSEEKMDTFGHGTLMTALVIETAPLAKLYVARIADNTAELDRDEPIRRICEVVAT